MKRLNEKLKLWGWSVMMVVLSMNASKCTDGDGKGGDDIINKSKPKLVIVGEDLSQTFKNFTPVTENDLLHLCTAVEKSKGGGVVVFIGIGSSKPQGQLICKLEGQKEIPAGVTPTEKKRIVTENKAARVRNKEHITQFVDDVTVALAGRNQPYTDINGFLDKVTTLVDGPAYEEHEKWLFINSDGKQDTKTTQKVNCKLKSASIDNYYVSGWKAKPDCDPDGTFIAPSEFVDYFTKNASK